MRLPDVEFIFANQGESADAIRQYLTAERLDLKNVLLDPHMKLGAQAGSGGGLPTTLFFNAEGRLVERHLGEISAGELAEKVEAARAADWKRDLVMRLINYAPINSDRMAQ